MNTGPSTPPPAGHDGGALERRGDALLAQGRPAEALEAFDAARALADPSADVLNSRGIALQMLGRLDEALADFDRAALAAPHNAAILSNRGVALTALGRSTEALVDFDTVLQLAPTSTASWHNRSTALRELERFEEALAGYDRALELQPAYPDALIGRGLVLMDRHRLTEAQSAFDQALALQPDHPKARLNAAVCSLHAGHLTRGFAGYEWRWRNPPNIDWQRHFDQPPWLGREGIWGKTVLLHAEQGLGDTIQFCRYATEVARRGARVILEAPRPLRRLLSTLAGPSAIVTQGEALPPFDFHCPLMSLPLALGTTAATIPAPVPYLKADPDLAGGWRTRLGGDGQKRVGLAWSGNPVLKNDRHRSIPLSRFAPLLASGATLVSLQKDLRPEDEACLARWANVAHFGDELRDFADTAALIARMDVVIAVDTAVAHLAGAMGKAVCILLPDIGVDWRWMTAREDSPWYPTSRLYRQPAPGDWDSVIARLGEELRRALQ